MTTDRDDIARCPFCGGEAKLRRLVEKYPAEGEHPAGEYDAWFYINCDDCGIEVGDEYESSAIEAWNRRAPSASMGRVTAPIVDEATFLLARLNELEWSDLDDTFRDFAGHVIPSMERLQMLLAALDSPPDHGGGEGGAGNKVADRCHPSHVTRISMDASSYDEICVKCGATDHIGGWGKLAKPCPCASLPTQESEDGR